METWQIPLIAGTAIVAVAVVLFAVRQRRARADALRQWGLRHGWTVGATADPGDRFRTALFHGRRRRGRCRNVMTRQDDSAEQLLFDYEYHQNTGSSTHVVRQTVVATRRPEGGLPPFELRPENLMDKIASVFGHGDIDFEHRPDFSQHYLLRGEDEAAIRKLFDATRLRFFEQNPGWSVESDGEWLVTYRSRRAPTAEDLDGFLAECRRIGDVLKPPRR